MASAERKVHYLLITKREKSQIHGPFGSKPYTPSAMCPVCPMDFRTPRETIVHSWSQGRFNTHRSTYVKVCTVGPVWSLEQEGVMLVGTFYDPATVLVRLCLEKRYLSKILTGGHFRLRDSSPRTTLERCADLPTACQIYQPPVKRRRRRRCLFILTGGGGTAGMVWTPKSKHYKVFSSRDIQL